MGLLFNTIQRLVIQRQYLLSAHASQRLEQRGIEEWQVADGITHALLLSERPHTRPNPTVEVQQPLADGTPITAVWALLPKAQMAMLVTVYFFKTS